MRPVFAIDVGGVLASKQHDGEPEPGSLEALVQLSAKFELFIVSMCGKKRETDTKLWLAEHKFPIPPYKQFYVRFSGSKLPVLNRIGAEYFIDDRAKHISAAIAGCSTLKTAFHYRDFNMAFDGVQSYQPVTAWYEVVAIMKDGL